MTTPGGSNDGSWRFFLIALSQIAGFCELDCKVSVADFTEMGFTESGFTETELMVSVWTR
jgi:hypothetical protein